MARATGFKVADFGVLTVNGVSLSIPPGQCIGLSGPSGSGKTLLLRAMADLDPHQGRMWLNGVASDSMPVDKWRCQVGLLPADSAWWHDTVGNPPMEAVKYQILTMFLIAGGTGVGTMAAVGLGARRLFDGRQRLRLDRLR